jgi:hypothetical protein
MIWTKRKIRLQSRDCAGGMAPYLVVNVGNIHHEVNIIAKVISEDAAKKVLRDIVSDEL